MSTTHLAQLWQSFPEFYGNPTIRALAENPCWTISDNTKRPIDARAFLNYHQIQGAHTADETCLVTLGELVNGFPQAANHAYRLNSDRDRVLIIDIEKTCPTELSNQLLSMGALYTETSMSGKGYHMVMPWPKNYHDFPVAQTKTVLKDDHNYVEILASDHYVTFTRQPVPAEKWCAVQEQLAETPMSQQMTWEDFYASMAQRAVPSVDVDMNEYTLEIREPLPFQDFIVDMIMDWDYHKTLDDFHGDHSRYEFGILSHYYRKLAPVLLATDIAESHDFTVEDKAWLIYCAATHRLEPREKHTETRNGYPYLLYQALSVAARRSQEEQEAQED